MIGFCGTAGVPNKCGTPYDQGLGLCFKLVDANSAAWAAKFGGESTAGATRGLAISALYLEHSKC